jgi:hypothetical protein
MKVAEKMIVEKETIAEEGRTIEEVVKEGMIVVENEMIVEE